MKKENILFLIIGLLAGCIASFLLTNQLNRSAAIQQAPPASVPPPGQQGQGAAMPQVGAALEKAEKNPQNFEAQVEAGEMFARIKNFDRAIPFFLKANEIRPDDYQILVILGNAFFFNNKFEEAEKWYEKALQKKPDDVTVRTDYGLTFAMRDPKDLDRAIKEYEKALSFKPNEELTLQNLSVALSEKGDSAKLQKALESLEKVNPENAALKKIRGKAG